ncbi:MAG: putative fibronectin type III-like fold domain, partial [Bacteroidota bacterium]
MKHMLHGLLAVVLVLTSMLSFAQTNPAAQALPYTQNFSAYTGSTTTYLAGWQGWDVSGTIVTGAAFLNTAPSANRNLAAGTNATTTRGVYDMNGKNGIHTTGSAISTICLAINTTSLNTIQVSYVAATQRTENTRLNELGLQYRIGTSGTFTNVTGATYQNALTPTSTTGTASTSPSTINVTLPVACENQAEVQLRWIIRNVSGSGNHPSFSIDDINISGTPAATPNLSVSTLTAFGGVCTGTDATNSFTISGTNLTTANVDVAALSGYTYSTDNTTFSNSLSLTQSGGTFSQLVYVKFSPTLVQSYNGDIAVSGGGASSMNVAASGSGISSGAPTLSTNTTTAITSNSATLGNNITAINCSNVTVRGIEWSTTQGFANGSGTAVNQSGSFGTGAYTVNVTGLPSSTIIYYHSYATNANGTTYSAESSFITYINITDLTIIGMNTTSPDNFAFVAWVDMPVGTKIKFTDNAFNAASASTSANNARGAENFVIWNNTTASAIAAGTVITITDGVGASQGSVVLALNGLSGSGEQIFAYQGPGAGTNAATSDWGTGAAGNHTFTGAILYGLNLQGTGTNGSATWLTTGSADANKSYLPSELNITNANRTLGGNAVGAQYVGPRTGQSTYAGYKTLLHNPAYWTSVTTGTVSLNTANFVLSAGGATQIAVTAVNGGGDPTSNSPFAISIETRDAGNVGAFVSQNTDVLVSIFSGTGTLLGTTTGTILSGQSILTISGLMYNQAETGVVLQVSTTSGDILLAGNSAAFNVLQGATQVAFANVSNWSFTNVVVPFFNVEARRPDNTVDNTYAGSVTINMISGTGAIIGTLTKSFVAGIATFNDISFDTPGVKQLEANGGVLNMATSATFTISTVTLTENILPQYMEGNQPSNSNRIPYACFLTINGLQPNATYLYSNQVVIASDAATNAGAGNPIFVSGGGFTRTTSPSFSTPGAYGSFTTNALGTYAGWYVLEPTANATRFASGTDVFMRLALNNGAGGTFTALRLTTTSSIRVMSVGTGATNGTALRGNSSATAMNFVVAYDNVNGTGRPISGTFVESDGVANTTANDYAAFYNTSVNGVAGAYGMIIPNTLPNGIRRLEQRFRTSGAITSCVATDADGVWPGGANTVNPNTGTTAKVITSTDAPFDPLCVPVIPGNNDNFINASFSNSNGSIYPSSRCFNGDLTGASISPEGNAANVLPGGGQDRWYMAVAPSSAFRITANSATVDLVIEMRMYDGTEVNVENAVVGPGQEIMFVTGLVPGTTYFFGARSYDGTSGAYSLCISSIMDGNCGTNTALPLDMCATFKTAYTGATNYTVTFAPVNPSTGGGTITTVGPFSLGTPALNLYPGNTYTVTVTSNYVGFVNGANAPEGTISLTDLTPCNLVIANHSDIQVRSSQRCSAPATLVPATILRTDPFVCGVSNYTFRFTPASDCAGTPNGLAFEYTNVSRNIALNFPGTATVPANNTIQNQTYYIVEVRPNYGPGGVVPGTYGTPQVIFIGGSLSAQQDTTAPNFEATLEEVS